MKNLAVTFGLLHTAAAAAALTLPTLQTVLPNSNCANISLTVKATAANILVDHPSSAELNSNAKVDAYFQTIPDSLAVSEPGKRGGTYNLAATYCVPSAASAGYQNANDQFPNPPLQILIHGATYTKEYWDLGAWGGQNVSYSWRAAANSAGYSTLAIDNLGNGQSSHPDPVWDVQLPLQVETIHAVIAQIKAGNTVIAKPRSIVVVGHSSGSILGADLVGSYPDDVDALVLTAYAPGLNSSINATVTQAYQAAAVSDPERFGNLTYGYLLQNNISAYTDDGYYSGYYDPSIAQEDYATRGVQPIGELLNASAPSTSPLYKGKVLVVTGENDQSVCGDVPAASCATVADQVMNVNSTFSSSTGFEYFVPLNTGHNINWHYSAPTTFDVTFQKLDYLLGRTSAGYKAVDQS